MGARPRLRGVGGQRAVGAVGLQVLAHLWRATAHTIDRSKRPICDRHFQNISPIPREPLTQRSPTDSELLRDVTEGGSFSESFENRAHVCWSAVNDLLACPRVNRCLPSAAFVGRQLTIPIGDAITIWSRLVVPVTIGRADASLKASESLLRSGFDLSRGSLMPAPPCAPGPKLDCGIERSGQGRLVRILEALRQNVVCWVLDDVLCFVHL